MPLDTRQQQKDEEEEEEEGDWGRIHHHKNSQAIKNYRNRYETARGKEIDKYAHSWSLFFFIHATPLAVTLLLHTCHTTGLMLEGGGSNPRMESNL